LLEIGGGRTSDQEWIVIEIPVRTLCEGVAEGQPVVLTTPLSFWGGFDVATGRIIDRSHPSFGEVLSGRIVIMPVGRGSSSGSSILAEAIRRRTAPAGLILTDPDPILTVGAIVAQKLYGRSIPIVVCPDLANVHGLRLLRITNRAICVCEGEDDSAYQK
jgi:predicted aconitase with swiveling domain